MTKLQGLIAKQVRRWELDKRISQRFAEDEKSGHLGRRLVTVSREKASGGSETAKLVARELGWDLYDREIIDAVALKARVEESVVEEKEEKPPNVVRDILLGFIEGESLTQAAYLRALVRVLRHIERQGNAVIIGRGASCVLHRSFRVRITAPFDLRVERVHELDGLSIEQARRAVLESDRARRLFVHGHFGCEPDDPLMYDMVINTERMSIEHAAQLVVAAVKRHTEEV